MKCSEATSTAEDTTSGTIGGPTFTSCQNPDENKSSFGVRGLKRRYEQTDFLMALDPDTKRDLDAFLSTPRSCYARSH